MQGVVDAVMDYPNAPFRTEMLIPQLLGALAVEALSQDPLQDSPLLTESHCAQGQALPPSGCIQWLVHGQGWRFSPLPLVWDNPEGPSQAQSPHRIRESVEWCHCVATSLFNLALYLVCFSCNLTDVTTKCTPACKSQNTELPGAQPLPNRAYVSWLIATFK